MVLAPIVQHPMGVPSSTNYVHQLGQQSTKSPAPRQAALNRIGQARSELAAAKDADAERKAVDELKAALGEYFDRDLEIRAEELERVQTGLANLTAALDKRGAAKREIVALQLKILVNEADGLGFFSGEGSGVSRVYAGHFRGGSIPPSTRAPGTAR